MFWLSPPHPEPEEGPPWTHIGGHLANCVPLERNGAGRVAPQAAGGSSVKLASGGGGLWSVVCGLWSGYGPNPNCGMRHGIHHASQAPGPSPSAQAQGQAQHENGPFLACIIFLIYIGFI